MDDIGILTNVIEAGARAAKELTSSPVAEAFSTVQKWIQQRYPEIDLSLTDQGKLSETDRVKLAGFLKNGEAGKNLGLLHRLMDSQQKLIDLPKEVISATGVNLENVKAEYLTIHDIYVNLPKPVEAPGFDSIVGYLETINVREPLEDESTANSSPSPAMVRLLNTPVHVNVHDSAIPRRDRVLNTVQQVFRTERSIGSIQRVVLLGESGVGKSIALSQLCQQIASESICTYRLMLELHELNGAPITVKQQEDNQGFTIPIFINLAKLQMGASINSLIRDEFNQNLPQYLRGIDISSEQIPELLEHYQCLLLFDSLDSITSDRVALQKLRKFMDQNRFEQYIISCRDANYRDQLGPIRALHLDDLNENEARKILGGAIE